MIRAFSFCFDFVFAVLFFWLFDFFDIYKNKKKKSKGVIFRSSEHRNANSLS